MEKMGPCSTPAGCNVEGTVIIQNPCGMTTWFHVDMISDVAIWQEEMWQWLGRQVVQSWVSMWHPCWCSITASSKKFVGIKPTTSYPPMTSQLPTNHPSHQCSFLSIELNFYLRFKNCLFWKSGGLRAYPLIPRSKPRPTHLLYIITVLLEAYIISHRIYQCLL